MFNTDPFHRIKVGIDLVYYTIPFFLARYTKVQILIFLLFVLGEFIFYLILVGFLVVFLMNSSGKSISEK
jgi:hypothetical protein